MWIKLSFNSWHAQKGFSHSEQSEESFYYDWKLVTDSSNPHNDATFFLFENAAIKISYHPCNFMNPPSSG